MKRIHPAADLGTDHDVITRYAPERRPAAMFGETPAIERGCIEQVDTEREGALCSGDRCSVIEPCEEIAERRGAEAEHRNLESGPAKHAAWQPSRSSSGRAGACSFR